MLKLQSKKQKFTFFPVFIADLPILLKKMSADLKRVSFMTIDTSSDFLKKPEKDTNTGNSKNKSVRLDLEIFEPDEYKFPEYNYKKLIYIEKVRKNSSV